MTSLFSPETLATIPQMTPEQYTAYITELSKQIPAKEILRAQAALDDTLPAFLAYYELIHGAPLVEHDKEPVRLAFEAHEKGEAFVWLGFRGCRKTTTVDVTLDTFLLGHHPEGTGVITGANDPNAKLIAKSVAQIIEYHPEFKQVFPHVVIDKDKGWGAEGYWIRDSRMSREAWTAQQAKVNDPSFVGGGYKSSEINGKHPSLFLSVDDLHDIDSSGSVTERENIKTVFFTQILPTVISEKGKMVTWVNITGVPFAKDDTYAVLKQSGGVTYYELPVMKRAAEGEGVYIDGINPKTGGVYEDIKGWWKLTWAENFDVDTIISWRSKGKAMFWQMFMLDIEIARTAGLKYYLYPHDKIGFDLPMVGGADPTGFDEDKDVGGNKRSHFALCYLGKLPQGGAVVAGGYLKACGILEAKQAILQAQSTFPNWRTTAVEDVGVGKVFKNYLRTDASVRVQSSNLTSIDGSKGIQNKPLRFQNEVAPWLEDMVIRISDAETPYLEALRRLCDSFYDLDKSDSAWDAGDALYHAAKLIPEVLRKPREENLAPVAMNTRGGLSHPLAGGGRR